MPEPPCRLHIPAGAREKLLQKARGLAYDRKKDVRWNETTNREGESAVIRIALVEDDLQYRNQLRDYIGQYAAASGQEIEVTHL